MGYLICCFGARSDCVLIKSQHRVDPVRGDGLKRTRRPPTLGCGSGGNRLPSWAVVATGGKAAGADVIRSHAQRAGADIIEVEGSHVIMISQPQTVADHILKAA
jgi:hypothetical protein